LTRTGKNIILIKIKTTGFEKGGMFKIPIEEINKIIKENGNGQAKGAGGVE
jgi:hypothetical protein